MKIKITKWNNSKSNFETVETGISNSDPLQEDLSIEIKELQKRFLLCCYQAGRFGEQDYCLCGRVIPPELNMVFKEPID